MQIPFIFHQYCLSQQGYLVEIGSQEEQDIVEIFMASDTQTGAYWLGLTDEMQEGTWKWQNSFSEASFTNWFCQRPQMNATCNCAEITMGIDECGNMIGWYDMQCEKDRDGGGGWGIHALCETENAIEHK